MSVIRTRAADEADSGILRTDSPFREGFYPNSHREKRKNALKVRFQQGRKGTRAYRVVRVG
jgi:hypothetical protein